MRSLRSRLALWVFLPILVCSAIDLFVTYRSTDRVATVIQQQLLTGSARIIAEQFSAEDGASGARAPPAAFELFADQHGDHVFYAVRIEGDRLIDGDAALAPLRSPGEISAEAFFITEVRGEAVRAVAYPQDLRDGGHIMVEVAQTLRGHAALRSSTFQNTAREHLILLALLLVALVATLRWTLRPLVRFSEAVGRRQPGSLEQLGAEVVLCELTPVMSSLNGYVVRLDQAVTAHESFVASTAHHLRTCFAILTSQLNYGMRAPNQSAEQRALLTAMRNTTAQGARVINQLLMLASIEQSREHAAHDQHHSASNLSDIITAVIEDLAPLAQRHQVELGVDELDDALFVAAPAHLLSEIVSNLIDNSIKHMNGPGSVNVQVRRAGGHAVLRVSDTGPGIAEEHRYRVFERFYRADPNKANSSGLGLSIVKEICEALKGRVELGVPERGTGLQVEVRLPLAARVDA